MDLDTGESRKLRDSDFTVAGTRITLQLATNHRYSAIISTAGLITFNAILGKETFHAILGKERYSV